jgi:hypothetical protein
MPGTNMQAAGIPSKPLEPDLANDIIFKGAIVQGINGRRVFDLAQDADTTEIREVRSFPADNGPHPDVGFCGRHGIADIRECIESAALSERKALRLVPS